jgi:hypothetical protein
MKIKNFHYLKCEKRKKVVKIDYKVLCGKYNTGNLKQSLKNVLMVFLCSLEFQVKVLPGLFKSVWSLLESSRLALQPTTHSAKETNSACMRFINFALEPAAVCLIASRVKYK